MRTASLGLDHGLVQAAKTWRNQHNRRLFTVVCIPEMAAPIRASRRPGGVELPCGPLASPHLGTEHLHGGLLASGGGIGLLPGHLSCADHLINGAVADAGIGEPTGVEISALVTGLETQTPSGTQKVVAAVLQGERPGDAEMAAKNSEEKQTTTAHRTLSERTGPP